MSHHHSYIHSLTGIIYLLSLIPLLTLYLQKKTTTTTASNIHFNKDLRLVFPYQISLLMSCSVFILLINSRTSILIMVMRTSFLKT